MGFWERVFDVVQTKDENYKNILILIYNLGYYVLAYNANKKEERKQKFAEDIEAIFEKCFEFLHNLIRIE